MLIAIGDGIWVDPKMVTGVYDGQGDSDHGPHLTMRSSAPWYFNTKTAAEVVSIINGALDQYEYLHDDGSEPDVD